VTRIEFYLTGLIILCVVLWGGYKYADYRGYQRCLKEAQAANLNLAIAYANRIVKVEGERDANQITIDRLTAESRRVQVHFPVCSNAGGENSNGTAGILSKRVDESFRNLQERGTVLFERCEALNADAIKINSINP
jgi:hypothetical protein